MTGDTVPHIPHADFKAGLPHGHFRVVVNPQLAYGLVLHLTRANFVALAALGSGAALALAGHWLAGGLLVLAGMAINRVMRHQAARVLLHLAQRNATVYEQATTQGVMEVRRS